MFGQRLTGLGHLAGVGRQPTLFSGLKVCWGDFVERRGGEMRKRCLFWGVRTGAHASRWCCAVLWWGWGVLLGSVWVAVKWLWGVCEAQGMVRCGVLLFGSGRMVGRFF